MALIRFGDQLLNTDTIADVQVGTAARALGSNSVTSVGHIMITTVQGRRIDLYQNETPAYDLVMKYLSDPANVTTLG